MYLRLKLHLPKPNFSTLASRKSAWDKDFLLLMLTKTNGNRGDLRMGFRRARRRGAEACCALLALGVKMPHKWAFPATY